MTPKQQDQLMCDYFNPTDTISVSCRWLQEKLQELERLKLNSKNQFRDLEQTVSMLKSKVARLESELPTYKLDLRG